MLDPIFNKTGKKTIIELDGPRSTETEFANTFTANDAIRASWHAMWFDDKPLGLSAMNPAMMFVPGTPLVDSFIGTVFEKLAPIINKRLS